MTGFVVGVVRVMGCVGGRSSSERWRLLGDDGVRLEGSDMVLESEKLGLVGCLRFEALTLDVLPGLVVWLRLVTLLCRSRFCWLVIDSALDDVRERVFCEETRTGCVNPLSSPR
jgi:hypothetical protein